MTKPKFTREQEDYICAMIGDWYLDWKHSLIDWENQTQMMEFYR